jgi:probable F420-dependent oxidoreductase
MKFSVGLLNSVHAKGLNTPEWHRTVTPAQQVQAMRLAEQLGYHKAGVPEHFVIPREHLELSGDHYPHAATGLAFIAGATERIRLASTVTILPLVHPIAQAKIWSTLDWLSGGRAVMNVGVGWLKEEFDLMGVNFHERGAICDEHIQAILALWTSDLATFEGRYVSFRDVGFAPKPVQQPTIPIWFGGDAPPMLRRVARWGAGWQPFLTPPEALPERLDFIRSQKDYHGRPIELSYSMLNTKLGEAHEVRETHQGDGSWNAAQMLDVVGRLADLGVTETGLPAPPLADFEAYLDWLRWGAEEVMAKAAD